MGGWPHQTVDFEDLPVSVAPIATTLGAAVDVRLAASFAAVVSNEDALQSLQLSLEASWDGLSGWWPVTAVNETQLAAPVAPGDDPRFFSVDCQDLRFVRIRGVASGVGLTATLSAQHAVLLPHR